MPDTRRRRRLSFPLVARELGERDHVVDALRGLAILGMILVNHTPPTDAVFAPFVHPPWSGWRLADTIFPAFLFLVGVSITLAPRTRAGASPTAFYGRVLRRFALLFLLSAVLINFPYYEASNLRLSGTLARIAWCYLLASLLHRVLAERALATVVVAIIALQSATLAWLPVPGFGAGVITPQGNAFAYVDALVFGDELHRFRATGIGHDGLLDTLGALATTLIGVVTGRWLQRVAAPERASRGLALAGAALFAAAQLWANWLPISKPLWSPSYVMLTAGLSLLLMAGGHWLVEDRGWTRWASPLRAAGVNALAVYVFAQCLQRLLVYGRVTAADGNTTRLRQLIYEHWLAPLALGKLGSLLYSLVFLAVCYGFALILYRARWFVRL